MKKNRLIDDIQFGGEIIQRAGHRWRFLTLTLSPRAEQEKINMYWARLRSSVRKAGYRFEFFKQTEFTENGIRHLHAIVSAFVPWGVIRHLWFLATDKTSWIVHIKKAQVKKAGAYMSKYMTKQSLLSSEFKKGERRYSFSRGFPRLPKKEPNPDYEFIYMPDNARHLQLAALDLGARIMRNILWDIATNGPPDLSRELDAMGRVLSSFSASSDAPGQDF